MRTTARLEAATGQGGGRRRDGGAHQGSAQIAAAPRAARRAGARGRAGAAPAPKAAALCRGAGAGRAPRSRGPRRARRSPSTRPTRGAGSKQVASRWGRRSRARLARDTRPSSRRRGRGARRAGGGRRRGHARRTANTATSAVGAVRAHPSCAPFCVKAGGPSSDRVPLPTPVVGAARRGVVGRAETARRRFIGGGCRCFSVTPPSTRRTASANPEPRNPCCTVGSPAQQLDPEVQPTSALADSLIPYKSQTAAAREL